MRILQVAHDFVPETMAGTEINTHKLAVDLRVRYGYELHVFCRGWDLQCEPYRERDEVLDGLQVRRVDFGRGAAGNRWQRHDPRLETAFRQTLERVRPDLVHIQHFLYLSTGIVAIAKSYGLPVVVSLRNLWFRCPQGTLLYYDDTLCDRQSGVGCLSCLWPDQLGRRRKIIPWRQLNPLMIEAYQRLGQYALLPQTVSRILPSLDAWADDFRATLLDADRLHSPSHFLKQKLIEFGLPPEHVIVIPNGIDSHPERQLPKQPGPKLRFGVIGAHRLKGLHLAIEAFRRLPPDAGELRVYGQVADRRYLAAQERRASGRNITFCGTYRQDQVYEVFSTLDVLIVPSIWYENSPTVIREAFATGTPVVAANIGGMAEAVRDGVDGLLFAAGDVESLHSKLQWLIAHPESVPAMAQQINRQPTAQECTDAMVELYAGLLSVPGLAASQGRSPDSLPMTDHSCQVSVIVPAYNEQRYIRTCLESLLQQRGCSFEILVVDDGSSDATPTIVQEFERRDSRVRLLRQERAGPGAARNRAAQQARGATLAFCDADMAFAPTYLATLTAPIQRGETIGTFSKEEYVANWDKLWARCWNVNDGIATNRRHRDDCPDQHEVFRAVRRDVFLKVGGFAASGSGDDDTLAAKIGVLAQVAPGALCYHHNPETLREAFSSARWYGRGRRMPATWRNILTHTPPVSIKRSLKRAIRHRLPGFIVLKMVVDLGILVGLLDRRFERAGPAR
jgi:glycosyltransferase involved in cell wall biosynthesis/GT2 family glycosyltransferase